MNFTDPLLTRRQLLASTAASALALSPSLSHADAAWPTKPLRLVVPFAPGGSSEIVARALAGELAKTIGQNVFHTKFGEGRVTGLEGVDADARAQVNFKRHGVKWLQLSIAKLAAID